MTWLEIIDTAVKIGLGALIGGVFAYLLNKQVHSHEIKRAILLDNRQTLKDISIKFESIHADIVALYSDVVREYDSYIRESASKKSKIKPPPDFHEQRFEIGKKLLLELYSLEGTLMLYGYKKMSSIIFEYRSYASAIHPGIKEDILNPEGLKKLEDFRVEFYKSANSYL